MPSRKPRTAKPAKSAAKPRTRGAAATREALTIRAFQEHIRAKYYATDSARGIPGTFMWLVEEVGELATALQKQAGEGGNTSGHADPAGEFADIIAWLCTLANISGVDLEKALCDKYFKGGGPAGVK